MLQAVALYAIAALCPLALAALSGWLLIAPLRALGVHVPINFNEGWNALHAARLQAGGPLYPPVGSGVFINYPPLSFYLLAGLGGLVGDNVTAGRLLSLACEAAVAIEIALVAARLGCGRALALLAALLFVLFTQIYFSDYIATNDPEWLGHAIQLGALVLLMRAGTRGPLPLGRLAAIVVLLLAGGLVKQSFVSLPIACTIWIAWRRRDRLLAWLALCLAAVAALGVLFWFAFGANFFAQAILAPRIFTTTTLVWMAAHILPRLAPFLLFGLAGLLLERRRPGVDLLAIYMAAAAATALLELGAVGVSYNAAFDLLIAAMIAGVLLGQAMAERAAPWGKPLAIVMLALPILSIANVADHNYRELQRHLAGAASWQAAIARIAAAPGPVFCEELALCYWAGRPSAVDLSNFRGYAIRHPEAGATLARRVAAGDFAMIQINGPHGSPRLPAAVNRAIAARYHVLTTGPTTLLVPEIPPGRAPQ